MHDQTKAAQNRENPNTASPPVNIAEPSNTETTQPATQQQLSDVEKQMTSFEKATLGWAKIAVLLSALAAAFVSAQWYEMRKGGKDTRALAQAADTQAKKMADMSTAADKIREAAQNLVIQDQRIADNAKASIQATQEVMRLDQRAWVVWKAIEGVPELDKTWTLKAYFTNSGKTPAKNVRVNCSLTPAKDESTLDFNKLAPVRNPAIIAPNDPTTYCELNPLKINKINQDVLNIFSSKEATLFFYGFVTYNDIFGKEHWVTFCHAMAPDGKSWNVCGVNNDTGDGKKPQQQQPKKAN